MGSDNICLVSKETSTIFILEFGMKYRWICFKQCFHNITVCAWLPKKLAP
jgi:hypothetical protein